MIEWYRVVGSWPWIVLSRTNLEELVRGRLDRLWRVVVMIGMEKGGSSGVSGCAQGGVLRQGYVWYSLGRRWWWACGWDLEVAGVEVTALGGVGVHFGE